MRATSKVPHDADMIPELAVRTSSDENYHVGVSYSLEFSNSLFLSHYLDTISLDGANLLI